MRNRRLYPILFFLAWCLSGLPAAAFAYNGAKAKVETSSAAQQKAVADLLTPWQPDNSIIDLTQPLQGRRHQVALFSDAGSWMGFGMTSDAGTFRGPYDICQRRRLAESIVAPMRRQAGRGCYTPGALTLTGDSLRQRLFFADAHTALLTLDGVLPGGWQCAASGLEDKAAVRCDGTTVTISFEGGERLLITFPQQVTLTADGHNYTATLHGAADHLTVAISFLWDKTVTDCTQTVAASWLIAHADAAWKANRDRWTGYLSKVIRPDMKPAYNRVAAKAIVTLIANWRQQRGGLLHDGLIPSLSVNYFVGCWAWDCWRFSAALASFAPELAKDNMRVMFDWQQADGMVPDCVYPNPQENNYRNSKPPLAAWAVDRIWECTHDTAFVREMLPKLVAYHRWWYQYRDHDHNGLCEFGATDGTLEAAAWESGMDNAIRFDSARMVRNGANAWSLDQESVDLNAYLVLDRKLLEKFAAILGQTLKIEGPSASELAEKVDNAFYDSTAKWFFDRRLGTHSFVREMGCEGYVPLWVGIATAKQFSALCHWLRDTKKFSTYIPFPTIAADNPKYAPNGYWRGPIWLDQTYYAIEALRHYLPRPDEADKYTRQVFDRLQGLTGRGAIYENYDTKTGAPLQSANFSWSAAHLLMLYNNYGLCE